MTFCGRIEEALGCRIGLFTLRGNLIEGIGQEFKFTNDVLCDGENTFLRAGNYIICANSKLSRDACNLIRLTVDIILEGEAADFMQPLEYILKNNVPDNIIRGKYQNYMVFYIQAGNNIIDMLKDIYEGFTVDIISDGEGIYLVKQIEEPEQEASAIINDMWQEKGINVIIGCGRTVGDNYTIKDSAVHAKAASVIARTLGYRDGFYHIDKMILYGLIDSAASDKIDFYMHGGYKGFNDVVKDKELIGTAEELFKCHLNISEAARRLYLHRNTLLYRIEKIKNFTGLDIKKFEEAVIFIIITTIYKLKGR